MRQLFGWHLSRLVAPIPPIPPSTYPAYPGIESGARRRNWDTCQTALFTLHGSGHNPRAAQTGRCRQRIMHKFAIYPKRFEEILCTGCGRCARLLGGHGPAGGPS